jgi:hypothetical protein
MNGRHDQIGFNRYLNREWLDFTASQMLAGRPTAQIKSSLDELLSSQLSVGSNAVRGSRGKTISMLLSIWVTVPTQLTNLRDEALEHMQSLSLTDLLPFHWGMTMTAYPFFGVVAESAGRSLNLQGNVSANLLKARMREFYGQRENVLRSTRYVLQCFSGWGLLQETNQKSGIYESQKIFTIQNEDISIWLLKVLLFSSKMDIAPLKSLFQSPRLFPFKIEHFSPTKQQDNQLEFFSQGLDEEMVMLKQ